MEEAGARAGRALAWRAWALAPLLLLALVVAAFLSRGSALLDLVGRNPPPADVLDIRRVEFRPGSIRIRVTNPQADAITIASVAVDDAIVPFSLDGPRRLERLRSTTIVVPFDWVQDDPLAVGVTSSNGIETVAQVPAAVLTPTASARGVLGYGAVGFLVGVVPVALGLLWLPSLRRAGRRLLGALMALTAGLLSFLAVDALLEALERQAALPGAGGGGLVLLGLALSYLGMTWLSTRLASRGQARGGHGSQTLALLIAIGIGVHNLGEGLAIGTSFAFGELTLGTLLVVGFMIHNVTEGLGIATPVAEGGGRPGLVRLSALALVAGAPAILGTWIGGYLTSEPLAVLFFAIAAGAALQVVVEVVRFALRREPAGLAAGHLVGGYLAGIGVMYATSLLVA